MKRKIIQITESGASDYWYMPVLCNDGTVWVQRDSDGTFSYQGGVTIPDGFDKWLSDRVSGK